MASKMSISLPVAAEISRFKLPLGVRKRLEELLDRQDAGHPLTAAERREAEGLVELAEFLTLLRLRASRPGQDRAA
jgi:hypothetical protein